MASPAWLALMVHVPAATSVRVVPLTVQTVAVMLLKVTGRPELAAATSAGGVTPMVWALGPANVIVWLCGPAACTVKLRTTGGAAA